MVQAIANLIQGLLQQALSLINTPILPGLSLNLILSFALFLVAISFIMRLLI